MARCVATGDLECLAADVRRPYLGVFRVMSDGDRDASAARADVRHAHRSARASEPPLSWAALAAAINASTRSSRSPAMTRSSLCIVRLIRWSVTRLSLKL